MAQVPISWYLTLSAVLFALGVAGFLFRRSIITVFMSIELMLNGANLAFVAFGRSFELQNGTPFFSGQIFVFFVIAVAAAEVAVGLALLVEIFKTKKNINIDELNSLKG